MSLPETATETRASSFPPDVSGTPVRTLAEIVFPLPVHQTFDYKIPEDIAAQIRPGHRVLAPFGHRGPQVGVVLRLHPEAENASIGTPLKSLEKLLDPHPVLSEQDLALARWLAERYFCSIGQAVFCVLPMGKHLPPKRDAVKPEIPPSPAPAPTKYILTEDQQRACEQILPSVTEGRFKPFLIWGVAAAGKTETYIQAIDIALKKGRSALYLVPEIGLTPQVEALLRSRFGPTVEVWHSEIAQGERWRIWQRVLAGECRVLLGPRSAVFAPLRKLGLLIVDEEHDPSYKEDSSPRYHAREVALEKGRLHGAPVVMGSATPSMESYRRALEGHFQLVEMSRRVHEGPPPNMCLVDLRKKGWALLSESLAQAVSDGLSRKEQTIFFLNRRGFATYIVCRDCGWEARCPDCGVSLVYHKRDAAPPKDLLREDPERPQEGLHCHYCSHHMSLPEKCPRCGKPAIKLKGRGTQRAASDLKLWFPGARILQWDRDTTRRRRAHSRAFEAAHSESVDIIVGTQMIAQGLDFPRVTVVGVLDADRSLRFPDFRAGERTFQLLTQVAGRAGRADKPGAVYLQTRNPDHYAIQAALKLDYGSFALEELKFRREMSYPPYVRLTQILLRGRRPERVERAAEELMGWLESLRFPEEIVLLGPAPAFHLLRAGRTQWQVMIKAPDGQMGDVLKRLREYRPPKTISWTVDVDPEELQ